MFNRLEKRLDRMAKALDRDVAPAAFKEFRRVTPIRTGNARRKTKLQGKVIAASYDYASYLDKGSSSQAPKGMSEPTTKFLNKLIRKIMRK